MKLKAAVLAVACAWLGACTMPPGPGDTPEPITLLIFHNNTGPMCLVALDWLAEMEEDYPALVVEEHLTYEEGETELMAQLEAGFEASQGVSTNFAYLPIIFFQEQAFSGFDDDVATALEDLLSTAASASSTAS